MFRTGETASGSKGNPTGKLWTSHESSDEAASWQDVVWSPDVDLYLATGLDGKVSTSPDGENWTDRGPQGSDLRSAAWGGGIYLVSSNGAFGVTFALTSVDGIDWDVAGTMPNRIFHKMIHISNDTFVVTANGGFSAPDPQEKIARTTDGGATWALRGPLITSSQFFDCMAYSPSLGNIVSVSRVGNFMVSEDDGDTWTSPANMGVGSFGATVVPDMVWCEWIGLYVLVAPDMVVTSPDGINWTDTGTSLIGDWNHIACSDDLKLLVATSNDTTPGSMVSKDAIHWYYKETPGNNWTSLRYNPDLSQYIAVANSGSNRVMTSP